jgi:hypothetical protein
MIIEIFKCKTCSIEFNSSEHLPILIPCGHSMCKKCLDSSCKNIGYVKCGYDLKKYFFDATYYNRNATGIEFFQKISNIKVSPKVMKYPNLVFS